jgi:hypothetical protein
MKTSKVRTINAGSPFENTYDLVVEILKNGEWKYYQGFNTLSNDYAYTEARSAANRAEDELYQLDSDRALGAE